MLKNTLRICAVTLCAAIVAGCTAQPGMPAMSAKSQRALVGAGAGAIAAKAFDEDVAKGALAGAAIGALCDDVGLCQPAY